MLALSNNSAVDHIDNVHQHEGVEASNVLSKFVCWDCGFFTLCIDLVVFLLDDVELFFKEHGLSSEHKDDHNNDLVDSLG